MKNIFKKPKIRIFKVITIIFSIVLLSFTLKYYIDYKYILIKDTFYHEFNQCNFENAKSIISDNNIYLKIKEKNLTKDLNKYFSSIVDKLCSDMLTNEVKKSDALVVFKEIKEYEILGDSLDKLILSLDNNFVASSSEDYKLLLDLGIESYNNKDFIKSVEILEKIPASENQYYATASTYLNNCASQYKEALLIEADKLASDDYYTKAIDLLSNADKTLVDYDDIDIATKINEIADGRDKYLLSINAENNGLNDLDSEGYQSASASILNSISTQNINTLNIESLTTNLIYVNLNEQSTYVYQGSMNDWNLVKEFSCSTGIESEETPTGIFTILNRGDWFFSDFYGQGGKYWVQFLGDYLFHSLPYNEDQSEILDYTLGTPASHGCIRLNLEDAKWIYDNILNGTKVIIN